MLTDIPLGVNFVHFSHVDKKKLIIAFVNI